jgi:preprotein translocase subunit SecY
MQAYGIAIGLEGQGGIVTDPGMFFRASTVITLTGGTVFLMWLGEQITSRGIGNGVSLIIFAGIVAGLPVAVLRHCWNWAAPARCRLLRHPRDSGAGLRRHRLHRAVERAQRRLLIQYPKRQVGMKMTQAESSHLPLKINTAGVIPRSSPRRCCCCPSRWPTSPQGRARTG